MLNVPLYVEKLQRQPWAQVLFEHWGGECGLSRRSRGLPQGITDTYFPSGEF